MLWHIIGGMCIGAATASAVWAYLHGRTLNNMAAAELLARRLSDRVQVLTDELSRRPLPPPSAQDAATLEHDSAEQLK